jgi:hypothetical protein
MKITSSRPQVRNFVYETGIKPLSDFCKTTVDKIELASWMLIPEHKLYVVKACVNQNGEKLSFKIEFSGAFTITCLLSYIYHKGKRTCMDYIAPGIKVLKSFFGKFVPNDIKQVIDNECGKIQGGVI